MSSISTVTGLLAPLCLSAIGMVWMPMDASAARPSGFDCEKADFFIIPGDLDTVEKTEGTALYVRQRDYDRVAGLYTDIGLTEGGYPADYDSCADEAGIIDKVGVIDVDPVDLELETPSAIPAGWVKVFEDNFDKPVEGDIVDLSNSFDSQKWSSKYPFSTDAKINTIPGEDDHWNVNSTGRYPGENTYRYDMDKTAIEVSVLGNFYNASHMDYLDALFDIPGWPADQSGDSPDPQGGSDTPTVFQNVPIPEEADNHALKITARTNPVLNRTLNQNKPFLSGLISSAANPDPSKESVGAHGFEFRYGYVEARVKLPAQGNGFRAALWLYSDNAFFNQDSTANKSSHEIDIMEYLPNSGDLDEGYDIQPTLFYGLDNASRPDPWKILTYDTIFHAYHYDDLSARTPTNWTFNGEARYQNRYCMAFGNCDGDGSVSSFPIDDFHRFGVLWEPDRIEWYVNDVLVHQLVPEGSEDGAEVHGLRAVLPAGTSIFDKRMYIIANLAMGLDAFEGPLDPTLLGEESTWPAYEIDYIRVYQNEPNESATGHVHCGRAVNGLDQTRCDLQIGIGTDSGGGSDPGTGGGGNPGKGGKPKP